MPSWVNFMLTSRRIIISIAVLVIGIVMIRLGFWQLDRLQQRIASNARVLAQINAAPLSLNTLGPEEDLASMQYRTITASGTYDFSQQVILTNQGYKDQIGAHLLTPLILTGSNQAILVDRGWIPLADATSNGAAKYDEPGQLTITGIIQLQQREPIIGISDPQLPAGQDRLQTWIVVNLDRIKMQVKEPLLPVYIQVTPPNQNDHLPFRVVSSPDLSNGPHLSYALQWFSFTIILFVGYPLIMRKQYQNRYNKVES